MNDKNGFSPHRRRVLRGAGALAGMATFDALLPGWAQSGPKADMTGLKPLDGTTFELDISHQHHAVDGKSGHAILVNNQLPAPLLRWREGDNLTLNVTNHLDTDTSIHWHGILLPFQMDGVPGVSFPGIRPGETFRYQFGLEQAGTYWYHSHSGLQEQQGHYGPIVIEPLEPEPFKYDRDLVVLLSDWTFEHPHTVFANLKKMSDVYNRQQRTAGDFLNDAEQEGFDKALAQRMMWGAMRMNPTDIADVTAATYTYLLNGHSPAENWEGLFRHGECVRVRFINASAMSIFNVRIPGLPMMVVGADGLLVKPVETDEFQIGVAETFDVLALPDDRPYTIFAESNDRSGYARGTLTPRTGLEAEVPPLRKRPLLSMKDMAMDHGSMGHGDMDHSKMNHGADNSAMDHSKMNHGADNNAMDHSKMNHGATDNAMDHSKMNHGDDNNAMDHSKMNHGDDNSAMDHSKMNHGDDNSAMDHSKMNHGDDNSAMDHSKMNHGDDNNAMDHSKMNHGATDNAMDHSMMAASGAMQTHNHPKGPGVVGLAMNPANRLHERPLGLEDAPHRVLVYTDLRSRDINPDRRAPEREMELHLTSNMERYMWSFDGRKFSEVRDPIVFHEGERLRLTMVNDTMMPHPIHLHGMFFEVVTAEHDYKPRKHTIVVKPGEKMAIDVTADAVGDWAFHCHLLYHMHAGMMRVVRVAPRS